MTKEDLEKIKEDLKEKLQNTLDESHFFDHVEQVKENALKICEALKIPHSKVDRNLMEFICLTHDLAYTKKKPGLLTYLFEGKIVKNILNKYLEQIKEITNKEKEIILNAVKSHPHSFPFRRLNKKKDYYTQILQDSDTLELFREKRKQILLKEFPMITFLLKPLYNIGPKRRKIFLNMPEVADIIDTN